MHRDKAQDDKLVWVEEPLDDVFLTYNWYGRNNPINIPVNTAPLEKQRIFDSWPYGDVPTIEREEKYKEQPENSWYGNDPDLVEEYDKQDGRLEFVHTVWKDYQGMSISQYHKLSYGIYENAYGENESVLRTVRQATVGETLNDGAEVILHKDSKEFHEAMDEENKKLVHDQAGLQALDGKVINP